MIEMKDHMVRFATTSGRDGWAKGGFRKFLGGRFLPQEFRTTTSR